MDLKERAKKVKTDLPALFIALGKKETPFLAKLLAFLTVAYALSPIDLVPDFIPILGYLDDLLILPVLAALTIKLIPDEIMQECKRESEGLWDKGMPKRWYYALPIVILWLLIVYIVLKSLVR